jgi:uncharacterized protein with PIN domain
MSRIQKAYEARFRDLLGAMGIRDIERGVALLMTEAQRMSTAENVSVADALTRLTARLSSTKRIRNLSKLPQPNLFFCDSGLGGLARWLRAAGYEAWWRAHIEDTELIEESRGAGATILTTDSMLLERRVLRDKILPSLWLPPTLSIAEQLRIVWREFSLAVREPRCMACGGELRAIKKEEWREKIPPKTYQWLDEFFVCEKCGKLFWRGTHWERIQKELRSSIASVENDAVAPAEQTNGSDPTGLASA